jgi:RNA polymerase sigma-70 factor (ECF subfamily)
LAEITGKTIRLGRLLTELQPQPEVIGLLALKLLRNPVAPREPTGELISLDDQDRALWNRKQIAEGFP